MGLNFKRIFRTKKAEPDSTVPEKVPENSPKRKRTENDSDNPKPHRKRSESDSNPKRSRKSSGVDVTEDQKIPPKKRKSHLVKVWTQALT